MAKALREVMQRWLEEEECWIVYAHGYGKFEATFTCREAQAAWLLPLGKEDVSEDENGKLVGHMTEGHWDGLRFRWDVQPAGKTRAICFQTVVRDAPVTFDLAIDGQRRPAEVFVGPQGVNPPFVPVMIQPRATDSGPVPEKPLRPEATGFHIRYHCPPGGNRRSGQTTSLDDETLKQLRSLGYLR